MCVFGNPAISLVMVDSLLAGHVVGDGLCMRISGYNLGYQQKSKYSEYCNSFIEYHDLIPTLNLYYKPSQSTCSIPTIAL